MLHSLKLPILMLLGLVFCPPQGRADEIGTLNPAAPARTAEFQFLTGSWLAHITVERPGAEPITATADWTIRYIMDGWGLRDDWFVTLNDGTISNYGTMYRTFDATHDRWTIVEQVTPSLEFEFMTAAAEGETMVMYEHEGGFDGPLKGKRVFYDITTDRFMWRHYRTEDGGENWEQGALMEVIRKKP